jgi:predicted nucleic acid-binding protein
LPRTVSDAGPLIHLAQINKLSLVKKLFKSIMIIPEVKREAFDEGTRLGHPDAQAIGKAIEEGWIVVEAVPQKVALVARKLAEGESISLADAKTLLLAREGRAEILVDEKVLSDLAKMHGLRIWSTWTILLESLRRGFIAMPDIVSALNELGEKRHKLREKEAAEILKVAKLIASRELEGKAEA